jgi:hypothetical protein
MYKRKNNFIPIYLYKYIQIQKICKKIVKQETHMTNFFRKLENKKDKFWRKILKKIFAI